MKIVIDDKIPYLHGQVERLFDEVVSLPGAAIGPADVRDADALMVRTRTRCDRRLLEGSRVRFVATATIGYDHLDTAWLDAAGIGWTNCPGCNATSVAQYVESAVILMEREGLLSPRGSVAGIVGAGHVGGAVAGVLRTRGYEVLLNDPPREAADSGAVRCGDAAHAPDTRRPVADVPSGGRAVLQPVQPLPGGYQCGPRGGGGHGGPATGNGRRPRARGGD